MTVLVRLFGPQAQSAGRREVVLDFPNGEISCGRVRQALAEADPRLGATLAASRLAVNHAFAADSDLVRAGDEVALIGPVSGG